MTDRFGQIIEVGDIVIFNKGYINNLIEGKVLKIDGDSEDGRGVNIEGCDPWNYYKGCDIINKTKLQETNSGLFL